MTDPHGETATQDQAAWRQVTRTVAFSFGLIGGIASYVDGGLPGPAAAATGAAIFTAVALLMKMISASRGLEQVRGASESKSWRRLALPVGALMGLLAGGGVYFHDGAPLETAIIAGLGMAAVGFLLMYFSALRWLAALFGLTSN